MKGVQMFIMPLFIHFYKAHRTSTSCFELKKRWWPPQAPPPSVGWSWCSLEAPPTPLLCRCDQSEVRWLHVVVRMMRMMKTGPVISHPPSWVSSCWGPGSHSHPPQYPCPGDDVKERTFEKGHFMGYCQHDASARVVIYSSSHFSQHVLKLILE